MPAVADEREDAEVEPEESIFPKREDSSDHALASAIRAYLVKRGRPTERNLVADVVVRRFRDFPSDEIVPRVYRLLDRGSAFRHEEGRYGLHRCPGSRGGRRELPGFFDEWRDSDSPGLGDGEGENEPAGRGDLWSSWVGRLGADAAKCHLKLTLEPQDRDVFRDLEVGVILFAGWVPSWLTYVQAQAGSPLVRWLSGRGWSAWIPHDHAGSPEWLAPGWFADEPLNDLVVGTHTRHLRSVEVELRENLADLRVPSERVDAEWSPLSEDERCEMERRWRLLRTAFTRHDGPTRGQGARSDEGRGMRQAPARGYCVMCGRPLCDQESLAYLIGPVCRSRVTEALGTPLGFPDEWGDPDSLVQRVVSYWGTVPLHYWAYARTLDFS